jgi:hypothetical protein
MKPETEKQLSTILDGEQQKKQAATQATAEAERTSTKNVGDFLAIKQNVIKPALQEIINMFKRRGIPIWMKEEDQQQNEKGGTTPARIGLEIYEQRPFGGGMTPEFKFFYYTGSRKLSLFTSTRSNAGPAKDVPFDAVTVDWIQEEFAKYAKSL